MGEEHWDHAPLKPSGAMALDGANKRDPPRHVSSKDGSVAVEERLVSMKPSVKAGLSATALLHLANKAASGQESESFTSPRRVAVTSVPRGDSANDMGDFTYFVIGFVISVVLVACGGVLSWKLYLLPKMEKDARKVAKDPPPIEPQVAKGGKKSKKDKGATAAPSPAAPESALAATAAASQGAPAAPAPLPTAPDTAAALEGPTTASSPAAPEPATAATDPAAQGAAAEPVPFPTAPDTAAAAEAPKAAEEAGEKEG